MARFQASRPRKNTQQPLRSFTNAEHLDHVRLANCAHPAVYMVHGQPIQGWCDGCRAIARGSR